MELKTGIEPVTSPLPRECSTTEPLEQFFIGENGAGDAIRTRDIQLGRLALYQLSYARKILVAGDGFEPSKGNPVRFTV